MTHRVGLIALLAVLLSPPGVSGQENYREWLGLCLGPDAGFDACANISIWTRFDPVREYTYATYQVSNLQGWAPVIPDTGPTSLYSFYLYGVQYTPPSWNPDLPYYVNSSAAGESSTVGNADIIGISGPFMLFDPHGMREGDANTGSRIYGCDGAPDFVRPEGVEDYSQFVGVNTCRGALRVEFEWAGHVELQDQMWAGFNATADGPNGEQLRAACRENIAGSCTMVTPEPSTWLMLATGLVGVGWFSRRRRAAEDA